MTSRKRTSSAAPTRTTRSRTVTEPVAICSFLLFPDTVRFLICCELDPRSLLRLASTSKQTSSKIAWKMLFKEHLERLKPFLRAEDAPHADIYHSWVVPRQKVDEQKTMVKWLHDIAVAEETPSGDFQEFYKRLASCTCIICGQYCTMAMKNFWFGYRRCITCAEQHHRNAFFKYINHSDALARYKWLKNSNREFIMYKHPGASTTKLKMYWEHQLRLAAPSQNWKFFYFNIIKKQMLKQVH